METILRLHLLANSGVAVIRAVMAYMSAGSTLGKQDKLCHSLQDVEDVSSLIIHG